ncbi:MAG: hypothetical protein M1833_007075 [Piccolia ochrophora]|nr:MAG: hypothetical protein M1833_007075 [Piccolia ochrophora]
MLARADETFERLSTFWVPTTSAPKQHTKEEDATSLLLRAGYIRQAHSGLFHFLPLGCRVQEKVQDLVDKHMRRLGASKLSLSSISTEALWRKSGRLKDGTTEVRHTSLLCASAKPPDEQLFRFKDRRDAAYLLSPTHEEEITSLVASITQSYKDMPLRLYQITRKYRDELRPRKGLLRTREFVMKDLYTFDHSPPLALETYQTVRRVYAGFFDEFKIPYLVAEADSGDMGGNLSHEYHFSSANGADHVVACSDCGYVANEELAESRISPQAREEKRMSWSLKDDVMQNDGMETRLEKFNAPSSSDADPFHMEISVWNGVTHDGTTLINAFFPTTSHHSSPRSSKSQNGVNVHAIKSIVPTLNPGVEDPLSVWKSKFRGHSQDSSTTNEQFSSIINLFDHRLPPDFFAATFSNHSDFPLSSKLPSYFSKQIPTTSVSTHPMTGQPLNLIKIKHGDGCSRCPTGSLRVHRATEVGHTFHLGTRYSTPFGATVAAPAEAGASHEGRAGDEAEETQNRVSQADAGANVAGGHVALQMGCHGIGISRIIGAIAETLSDAKGLNWPRVMAPFDVAVIPRKGFEEDGVQICEILLSRESKGQNTGAKTPTDVILDDRGKDFIWKLRDADLVGYPVIVVLGKAWASEGKCEVQCRRLNNLRVEVPQEELLSYVRSLLTEL